MLHTRLRPSNQKHAIPTLNDSSGDLRETSYSLRHIYWHLQTTEKDILVVIWCFMLH